VLFCPLGSDPERPRMAEMKQPGRRRSKSAAIGYGAFHGGILSLVLAVYASTRRVICLTRQQIVQVSNLRKINSANLATTLLLSIVSAPAAGR